MEKWEKTSRDHREQHHREKSPSFSSTLLDVIYRSIDEGQTEEKEESLIFYRETMRKQKQSNCFREEQSVEIEAGKPNFCRARKVENWTERRNSLTELERRTRSNSNTLSMYSSSSSSESSSAGGFSSSESESFYGVQRPKPIRTSVSEKLPNSYDGYRTCSGRSKPSAHPSATQVGPNSHTVSMNDVGRKAVWTDSSSIGLSGAKQHGFGKTKSKALRILYGELKKAKQPVSPGARLASFLNSLFNSGGGNAKKAKVSSSSSTTTTTTKVSNSAAQPSSTCSSASSFSRSCLSKTPSSRSGAKRSVRFCPVSVIVDEDCRPCGHKNLREADYGKSNDEELRLHVMNESRRVEELARELLKNYQKKNAGDFDHMQCEDEDDAESCSSSDLFELDNLSAIGIERYREELPVYETTHFKTNRAIANGFVM